ncbi:hypothetical protein T484DRAFT_1919534 [Baffinella frigidus]|nr:hypothetical protein T484DRAFT_1919534 [Cryptophyta sp. CCMP2293]
MFTFKAASAIYGGESIVIDLPHYTGADGAVFGVTSSPSTAFTTYLSSTELADNKISQDKSRAMFTGGYVATGSDKSGTADVAGTLILDSDDTGYSENKDNWFAEGNIWEGKASLTEVATITAPADSYGSAVAAYFINATLPHMITVATVTALADSYGGSAVAAYFINATALVGYGATDTEWAPFGGRTSNGEPDADDDALAGTIMTCMAAEVTQSRYILEGSNTWTTVYVERAFTIATTACGIAYKSTVGKYTGHTVMMENGMEYTMKQGGGPFYSVSDGTGNRVASTNLDAKKYTVYSQLILTAAKGASIAKGEEVTVMIPMGVIVPPAETSALVNEEDDNRTSALVNEEDDNKTSALVNEDDDNNKATIAKKTTIKHMLVTTIHYTPARTAGAAGADGSATLTLSKTWPYAYDYENEQSLTGSYVELFGAVSLLAAGAISAAPAANNPE